MYWLDMWLCWLFDLCLDKMDDISLGLVCLAGVGFGVGIGVGVGEGVFE